MCKKNELQYKVQHALFWQFVLSLIVVKKDYQVQSKDRRVIPFPETVDSDNQCTNKKRKVVLVYCIVGLLLLEKMLYIVLQCKFISIYSVTVWEITNQIAWKF